MKIVINNCFGGFGLSDKAILRYAEIKGIRLYQSKERMGLGYSYYLVPEDEYNRLYAEDIKRGNFKLSNEVYFSDDEIKRTDHALIQVVEELGEEVNERFANLVVVEIPDDVKWEITEYDGVETIEEEHRKWS